MTYEPHSANTAFEAWITEARDASCTQEFLSDKGGYIESAQTLLHPRNSQWENQELLDAARRAVSHHAGWPVGIVSDAEGYSPTLLTDGIEVRIPPSLISVADYWSLKDDGRYYFSRFLKEDIERSPFLFSQEHPEKFLLLDFGLTIQRIADLLLHSASLYRALNVPPDEHYLLSINHGGLQERNFCDVDKVWSPPLGQTSTTDLFPWQDEVTQDRVTTKLKELTREISTCLFSLFGIPNFPQAAVSDLIDTYQGKPL